MAKLVECWVWGVGAQVGGCHQTRSLLVTTNRWTRPQSSSEHWSGNIGDTSGSRDGIQLSLQVETQFSQADGQSYQAESEFANKLQAAVHLPSRLREDDGRGGARDPRQGEARHQEEEVREHEDILEAEKVRAIVRDVVRRASSSISDFYWH